MKNHFHYLILIYLLLLLGACKKPVTQEDLIKAAIDLKIEQWREGQVTACKEKAYQEAENYVDSMLIVLSLETKMDTIPKPQKPVKPPKPVFKNKPDSVVVDPIIEKG